MIIESKRLILRSWKDEDINDLVEGLNNINVSKLMAGVPFLYTLNDARWMHNRIIKRIIYWNL